MKRLPTDAYRGAIRAEHLLGKLTVRQMAEKFGVSTRTVQKWKVRDSSRRKKRVQKSSKVTKDIKRFLVENCQNKFSGIDGASCRKMSAKIAKHFNVSLSKSTVNTYLNRLIGKPMNAGKTFFLSPENKEVRRNFAQWIIEKDLKGRDIIFTDEKIFRLHQEVNTQINKIRLSKKFRKRLRKGDPEVLEKVRRPMPKYSPGVMVAAGLSYYGVTKLVFCVGTMNTVSYERTLRYWLEDVRKMNPDLYFQQDGASPHRANIETVKNRFKNYIPKWPANSPGKYF
jgi:transposase